MSPPVNQVVSTREWIKGTSLSQTQTISEGDLYFQSAPDSSTPFIPTTTASGYFYPEDHAHILKASASSSAKDNTGLVRAATACPSLTPSPGAVRIPRCSVGTERGQVTRQSSNYMISTQHPGQDKV